MSFHAWATNHEWRVCVCVCKPMERWCVDAIGGGDEGGRNDSNDGIDKNDNHTNVVFNWRKKKRKIAFYIFCSVFCNTCMVVRVFSIYTLFAPHQ